MFTEYHLRKYNVLPTSLIQRRQYHNTDALDGCTEFEDFFLLTRLLPQYSTCEIEKMLVILKMNVLSLKLLKIYVQQVTKQCDYIVNGVF